MRLHLRTFIALIAVAAFGLVAKLYPGPGRRWVNNWGPASVAYLVFFMLAAFLVVPRRELATRIAVGVLLVTCGLEFLQLWHPTWLEAIQGWQVVQGCERGVRAGKAGAKGSKRAFRWAFQKRNLPFMVRSTFENSAFPREKLRLFETVCNARPAL